MATETTMATETDFEREIDHTVDTDLSDDEALATLSDRQEHRVQMQEIKRRTVEPGLMKLSVDAVDSAENSQNWAIDIDHPAMEDPLRVFAKKPLEGWSRDYKLVRLCNWYGIHDQDPHKLEFHDVYMRKDEDESEYAHGWVLEEPPEYRYTAPMSVQVTRTKQRILNMRPNSSNAKMWVFLLIGALVSSSVAAMESMPSILIAIGVTLLIFVVTTIIGMAVLDGGDAE